MPQKYYIAISIIKTMRILSIFLTLICALPIYANGTDSELLSRIADGDSVYMLTYFRQRYPTRIEIDSTGKIVHVPLPDPMNIEKLHIALSHDGRHWVALNDNRPVWDQQMRYPYVRRGHDGMWRLLATGGGRRADRDQTGPSCLYATSPDLVHWQKVDLLPLMKGVRDENGRPARNIWAPEWFYDEKAGDYFVVWSSSFEDAGWKKSRLWYSCTKDWKEFTPAKPLFEPEYSVIDGTVLLHDGKYYLFHKEEEFGELTGERRAIRVAVADKIEGPYEIIEGHLNGGQIVPVITEGPSAIMERGGEGCLLYYDYCMADGFGVSRSSDFRTWTIEDSTFPSEARHGTVSLISAEEARRVLGVRSE